MSNRKKEKTAPDAGADIATGLAVDVEFDELADRIQGGSGKPAIQQAARAVFDRARGTWQPAMVCQWFGFNGGNTCDTGTITVPRSAGPRSLEVHLGHSGRFIAGAARVLAAVYTAGPELDRAGADASRSSDFLAAHFLDTLGLIVLGKVEELVKSIAEKEAASAGWGVSPFLSPGSVHGWELDGQSGLASLLPIHKIGVTISESAVFTPFKTISCLIGIGPGFNAAAVGSTCQVCSRRNDCRMKQSH